MKLYAVMMTEDGMSIAEYANEDELMASLAESEIEPEFVSLEAIDECSGIEEIALIRGEAFIPKPKTVVAAWDFGK